MDHFYKQPKYFSKFRCIGGDCPDSCCDGWTVLWKDNELDRIRKAEISADMRERLDDSFVYDKENGHYEIKPCDDGRCPFHNRDTDLCDIQRELGEKYLGAVCGTYPRHYIESKNQVLRWCATSCPAVIDLLYEDERATEPENIVARDYDKLERPVVVVDDNVTVAKDPIKRMRTELFDFYTRMLLNSDRDIETSMILIALAVKHLTDAEGRNDLDAIPKIIHDLEPQLNNPATVASIGDIKPNYQLKFKLVNNMMVKFFGNDPRMINISVLHNGNELVIDRYLNGLDKFRAAFDGKDHILRNIIMNLFYDVNMPIGKLKRPLFENYAYFVLAAMSVKTVAAAIGYIGKDIKVKFRQSIAEMSRSFAHNIIIADAIAEDIKQMGLTSPAHLALLIRG